MAVKPAALSWEAAEGFLIPALTAAEALRVQPSETVVVNGAGGVTGRLLVSLAVLMDARVIAVAGPRPNNNCPAWAPPRCSTTTVRTGPDG